MSKNLRSTLGSGIGIAVPLLLTLVGMVAIFAPAPAMGQGEEPAPPCDLKATRDVSPLSIYAGEQVTVTTRIEADCTPQQAKGIDIMFVVDRSITVHEDGLLTAIKDGLTAFTLSMSFERGSAGMITFAANSQVATNLTHDQTRVLDAINRIRLSEESDTKGLAAAFRTAVGKLDNDGDPANEKIVLITIAGQDAANALVNMPTVTNAARNAGVKVVFMLFPGARFRHFVEAASDCDDNCPMYQLPGGTQGKWAWYVDETSYETQLKALSARLLRARTLDKVEHEEYLHSGAVLVPGSLSPPAMQAGLRLFWELNTIPEAGITLTYRVRMIYPDDRYPTADSVVLQAIDDQGTRYTVPVDNPDVEVLDPALRPTEEPTPTTVPPTLTPEPPTATPTATLEPPPEGPKVYLPIAYREAP